MKFEGFKPGRWQQVNHDWHWEDARINVLLEAANRALGELNAFSLIVPDIDLFIGMHVVKEAQTSSRIEGTQTGIDEAVLPEEQIKPEKRDDWREVQNHINAVNYAIGELRALPLSNRLLRQTHAILLRGARGQHKQPGDFRVSQNWIGGSSLADAAFIPPHHEGVAEYMGDLEAFWHNQALPAQHRPRPAARLARQGRAGLERPRRLGAAALHPGEGAPKVLIDDLLRSTKERKHEAGQITADLFADFNGIPKGADKTEFYQHDQNWTNRMILGDSCRSWPASPSARACAARCSASTSIRPTASSSTATSSGAPPAATSRMATPSHITREPEQVKAFRDTWRDGIHSYLTYLRDRLTVARDLLTESGSIFVQIGDENVHRVRAVMDEVFEEDQ
jgi:hypothetical protein